MSTYSMRIEWNRDGSDFLDQRYSRKHTWIFDGGETVPASSSPNVVPIPHSDESAVDPEEAFIASVSSCHMLWFLSISAKMGYLIDAYSDEPVGTLQKSAEGKMAITDILLRPDAKFSGEKRPDRETIGLMHREAHDKCFIANSVKTNIRVDPVLKD